MDHDRLFKGLLKEFFAEFVDLFLPNVSAYLERKGIEFLDKEVFTDVTAGERHEVDLVAKALFRGATAYFLIHVENQATAREGFARRMFVYFARLHEKCGLPVYPVALLSFDSPLREEPAHYRVEFPDKTVLDFNFEVVQLHRLNWRDFLRNSSPVAAALMAKMRIAPEDRPRVKLECLRMIATLRLDPARSKLISSFVDSYLRLSEQEEQAYDTELGRVSPE